MSKQEQILQIEPQNELRFKGPFNVPVTSYMKLTNPSDKKVLFKIKTTAPKKYCVRPNSGVLDANSNTEIAICLQPFLFDPAEKNKHKFMVQTVFAPEGEINLEQLWKEITPEQLMDSKLKCVFEMPPEHTEISGSDDTAKFSPKTAAPVLPTNSADSELQKAAQEVQQLREEESQLRQENLLLKEEILQLKQQVGVARAAPTNRYAPPVQDQNVPMVYLAMAVILGLIGIILGKFAL
ncbi:LOW QUALITY PROTEIN: vesicle-associated membrane protein-associated protein B/C [Leptinotarsa decemlineata]|uniref:LOW QUALITY PROTEIN: vesicle-associated membrane protein-associated protein B/C n=1 Tax=Leptinotarsa decemlineata TaxID=7539 RepID=UPI000C25268B|nr:vesicle-associated membrane protein-associated protein B/C [Leptinotarsa decemlineata]